VVLVNKSSSAFGAIFLNNNWAMLLTSPTNNPSHCFRVSVKDMVFFIKECSLETIFDNEILLLGSSFH